MAYLSAYSSDVSWGVSFDRQPESEVNQIHVCMPPDKDTRSTEEQIVAQLASINRTLKWLPLKTALSLFAMAAVLIALLTGWLWFHEFSESLKGLSGISDK